MTARRFITNGPFKALLILLTAAVALLVGMAMPSGGISALVLMVVLIGGGLVLGWAAHGPLPDDDDPPATH